MLTLALSLVFAAPVVQGPTSRHASPPAAAPLSAKAVREHVDVLASDWMLGRKTATHACRVAGEYIALRLDELGAEPIGGTYFQSFEVDLGRVPKQPPKVAIVTSKADVRLVNGRDFVLLPHSGSGSLGWAKSAEMVFCGHGVSMPGGVHGGQGWDDYEGKDVKGKVVVVLDGSPEELGIPFAGGSQRKLYTAKAKGAAAFVLVADAKAGDLPAFRAARDSAGIPGLRIAHSVIGKYLPSLAKAIESGTGDAVGSLRIDVEMVMKRGKARNVIGMIRGNDPKLRDEFIVLGAHYDHLGLGGEGSLAPGSGLGLVHNGADDNASGVAVMLEVGRALVQRKKLGRSVLLIAFSGEEEGLLGSSHFVHSPTVPKDKIVAMVNLDMVGRSKKGYIAAIAAGTSPAFTAILSKTDASVRLNDSSLGGSDHQSFIAAGIPAVHFFSGTHSDYHRPSDDVERLNVDGMVRIGGIVLDLVEQLSRLPERPEFVKPKPSKHPAARAQRAGPRPYLGTIPDYAGEGDTGVKISGVTPGSPVAKAGMKAGDVLVKIGDRDIGNIYDFSYALNDMRPGQKVKLEVMRGKKRVKLEVTVGAR